MFRYVVHEVTAKQSMKEIRAINQYNVLENTPNYSNVMKTNPLEVV